MNQIWESESKWIYILIQYVSNFDVFGHIRNLSDCVFQWHQHHLDLPHLKSNNESILLSFCVIVFRRWSIGADQSLKNKVIQILDESLLK